ncbi:MAG TPA: hypothetical protein DCP53_06350 [Elusimicrobia bacterium]|nr:MAG: hypothetical protein A2551_07950 [Elusimicrobia bacterium RIFOXYD2_FULL_34_30]HAM38993.1 hypothetical protein [Elusimicrobiota bacterium]
MDFTDFLIAFIIIVNIVALIEMAIYKKNKEAGKKYYNWVILITLIFYIMVMVSTLFEYFYIKRVINYWIVGLGFIMLIPRFVIKYFAAKELGKYWGIHIEIRENHKLIKTGIFKYLRHPGYLSTIFEILVVPVVANTYFTVLWSFVIYMILLALRIYSEEKVLIGKFGKEYIEYKRSTWRILPYVY